MFTRSTSVRINDGVEPELSLEQVWRGLQIRARNEDERFVPPGHRFEILEDHGDWLLRSVHLHDGRQELQRVSFHGRHLVVFDFIEGTQQGLILSVIETDAEGQHCLRVTFLSEFAGMEHGSAEEADLAASRQEAMAAQPSRVLDVMRELVKEGTL